MEHESTGRHQCSQQLRPLAAEIPLGTVLLLEICDGAGHSGSTSTLWPEGRTVCSGTVGPRPPRNDLSSLAPGTLELLTASPAATRALIDCAESQFLFQHSEPYSSAVFN